MAKIALVAGAVALGVVSGGILGLASGSMIMGALEGAAVGEALGSTAASLLFPGHNYQQGPKLNDLMVSSSTDGAAIPFGYGTYRLGGNIIWSPGLVEHQATETTGGKGGPSTTSTTYSYSASFAVSFGEGPGTIKKLWGDSKLIYDASASSKYPPPTLYGGTQTQAADPDIQADKGAANTPAFRHLVYAVFADFPLANFGNRIPTIRGEVQYSISSLQDMVADICERAGLDSSLIDVSTL